MKEAEKTNIKFTVGKVGQLIIEGSGIFLSDGVKEWIEEHNNKKTHLLVNCCLNFEAISAFYLEFIDLKHSFSNKTERMEDGIFADVDESFQIQFAIGLSDQLTVLCCQNSFSFVNDPMSWFKRYYKYSKDVKYFVIHSTKINDGVVRIVFSDPE